MKLEGRAMHDRTTIIFDDNRHRAVYYGAKLPTSVIPTSCPAAAG